MLVSVCKSQQSAQEAPTLYGEKECAASSFAAACARGLRHSSMPERDSSLTMVPCRPHVRRPTNSWHASGSSTSVCQDRPVVRQPSGTVGCPDVAAGEANANPLGFELQQRLATSSCINAGVSDRSSPPRATPLQRQWPGGLLVSSARSSVPFPILLVYARTVARISCALPRAWCLSVPWECVPTGNGSNVAWTGCALRPVGLFSRAALPRRWSHHLLGRGHRLRGANVRGWNEHPSRRVA